ncbi:MAG TPA: response regulator [Verrucomicrobiae bacterium]|nr:response regulator [Verrucomicrobiae bacterium]
MGIFTAAIALMGRGGLRDTEESPRARHSGDGTESRPTVLIIDDDTSFLEAMRTLLTEAGYNVLTSSTGPKGLDMVRYAPRDIAAVLLDFNMPRFNGAETLQFLRKLSPHVKVLAVSGISLSELPSEFREGVQRVVSKPFSNNDLLKTIDEVLHEQSETELSAASAE